MVEATGIPEVLEGARGLLSFFLSPLVLGLVLDVGSGRDAGDVIAAHVFVELLVAVAVVVSELGLAGVLALDVALVPVRAPDETVARAAARPAEPPACQAGRTPRRHAALERLARRVLRTARTRR